MAFSLLLTIFLIQLASHIINTIGANTINEILWTLYLRLPFLTPTSLRQQSQLRARVLQLKRSMAAISAQDDFARWAKLRREHDKALAQHDALAAANASLRTRFDLYANAARWIATAGLGWVIQFWYSRTPVFTLPRGGWAPGWVEWCLGWPRVKVHGGVSVVVWGWACKSVIERLSWGVQYTAGMLAGRMNREGKKTVAGKTEKIKVPAAAPATSENEKKEL